MKRAKFNDPAKCPLCRGPIEATSEADQLCLYGYENDDEQALQAVAKITEGEFYRAGNSQDLKEVYRHLSSKFSLERRDTEVSALFGAASLALTLLALLLSLLWFKRSANLR